MRLPRQTLHKISKSRAKLASRLDGDLAPGAETGSLVGTRRIDPLKQYTGFWPEPPEPWQSEWQGWRTKEPPPPPSETYPPLRVFVKSCPPNMLLSHAAAEHPRPRRPPSQWAITLATLEYQHGASGEQR